MVGWKDGIGRTLQREEAARGEQMKAWVKHFKLWSRN